MATVATSSTQAAMCCIICMPRRLTMFYWLFWTLSIIPYGYHIAGNYLAQIPQTALIHLQTKGLVWSCFRSIVLSIHMLRLNDFSANNALLLNSFLTLCWNISVSIRSVILKGNSFPLPQDHCMNWSWTPAKIWSY